MWKRKKPSTILMDYVDGKGRGDEIDDLVHGRLTDTEETEIVEPLLRISKEYRTNEHPIGIGNPESFEAIRELAVKLRDKGM